MVRLIKKIWEEVSYNPKEAIYFISLAVGLAVVIAIEILIFIFLG